MEKSSIRSSSVLSSSRGIEKRWCGVSLDPDSSPKPFDHGKQQHHVQKDYLGHEKVGEQFNQLMQYFNCN